MSTGSCAEVSAQRPGARARARGKPPSERRVSGGQVDVFAAVEAEAEREHPVGVTERVEPARELDRDELGAAALAPGDEMQDPHGVHRAMSAYR